MQRLGRISCAWDPLFDWGCPSQESRSNKWVWWNCISPRLPQARGLGQGSLHFHNRRRYFTGDCTSPRADAGSRGSVLPQVQVRGRILGISPSAKQVQSLPATACVGDFPKCRDGVSDINCEATPQVQSTFSSERSASPPPSAKQELGFPATA